MRNGELHNLNSLPSRPIVKFEGKAGKENTPKALSQSREKL
jgi:hypothetical protein